MDADAGRLGRRRLSEGEEARVEPGSLRGLRVVATPAPVTPEDLAVLQADVLVGYVFAQAAAGPAGPGRRRAARETRGARPADQEDSRSRRGEPGDYHRVDKRCSVQAVHRGCDAADHGSTERHVANDVNRRDQPGPLSGWDQHDRGAVSTRERGAPAEPRDRRAEEQGRWRAGLNRREGHQGTNGRSAAGTASRRRVPASQLRADHLEVARRQRI